MLNPSTLISQPDPSGKDMSEVIKSRFGDITVSQDKALQFPRGLLGMPDKNRFALAGFPNEKMAQFTILQSLDDKELSFITMPIELDNDIIEKDDIRSAIRDLQIEEKDLAVVLVVSVHRGFEEMRLSVNARAPLLIDVERKIGIQYVFPQDNYKVQHML